MIGIEKGNEELYRLLFAEYTTAYTDKCAEEASADGRIIFAYLDGVPAGYLFTVYERGSEGIRHFFTKPDFRGQGVMQAMIRYVTETSDMHIATGMSSAHKFAPVMEHVFKKLGFSRRVGRNLYRCDAEDMWERWDEFMAKSGNRLCDTLRRQGYKTVTLSDAPEDLLWQFRRAPYSEYKCEQNHQHLILPGAEVTQEISVMCTLNGRLAAYVFAYMPDSISAIYKTLSSSAALQGGGVIMLAIAESLQRAREHGVKRLVFTMESTGKRANAFREKVLSVLVSKPSYSVSYFYDTSGRDKNDQ